MYVCMCVCNKNVQLKRNFTTGSFFEKDIKPPFTEETIGAKRFVFFCMCFFNRLYLPKPLSINENTKNTTNSVTLTLTPTLKIHFITLNAKVSTNASTNTNTNTNTNTHTHLITPI